MVRRIAFGAVSGWASRGITILLGLFLMPVLFKHLHREELGVWLLLGQSWATLGVLDLGLGATLTRRIAFAVGKSGVGPGARLGAESLLDVANLVETGRRLCCGLAIATFLIAFSGGLLTLRSLHLSSVSVSSAWTAWGILCLAQAFGVWSSIWHCLLLGTGYVGWDSVLAAAANSIILTVQIAVVLCGGGLIGMAIVATVGVLMQRFLYLAFARRRRPELFSIKGRWQGCLLENMWAPSLKAWITSTGSVIITNSDQFFIAGLEGANQIPEYRAAYLIFVNLNILAVTFAMNSSVFIAQLWQANARHEVHRIVMHSLRLGLIIMVTGGACVLALGRHLFNLWIGHGNYIGPAISGVFFVLLLLEAQSFMIATCSRATEDEAFAGWTAAAASLKIALSLLLGARYGLIGIALGTLIAQLSTNHWFMCYRGLRRLGIDMRYYLRHVLCPIVLLFFVTFGLVQGLAKAISSQPDWLIVSFGALVSGCLLGSGVWLLVLNQSQREFAIAAPGRVLRATFSS